MKRWICLLLSLLMLTTLAGCAAKPQEPETTDQTVAAAVNSEEPVLDLFVKDWINLLLLQETRLAQENQALKQILMIGEAPTWENYVYAQTAASFTCELIGYLSEHPVVPEMTAPDYQVLVDMGMDVGDVEAEYRSYNEVTVPSLAEVDRLVWFDYYLQNLMYACFDEDTLTVLLASAQNRYDTNLAEMQYWYLVNNYIMLELPQEQARKLMELAGEYAPTILSQYASPLTTTTEVYGEMNRALNRQEECLLVEEQIQTAWALLLEETEFPAKQIEGLPQLIRYPESISVDSWDVQYYWKEGEEIRTYEYGMEMETPPNAMFMEAENVPLEAYMGYVMELMEEGLEPVDMTETAALYSLDDGVEMVISHEDNTVCISVTNGQVCFAPVWYLQALNQRN